MKELIKQKEEPKKEVGLVVVRDIPTQQIRKYIDEDDKEFEVLTIEEALTELLTKVRQIHTAL